MTKLSDKEFTNVMFTQEDVTASLMVSQMVSHHKYIVGGVTVIK